MNEWVNEWVIEAPNERIEWMKTYRQYMNELNVMNEWVNE